MIYSTVLPAFGRSTSVWNPPGDGAFTLANRYPFPFPYYPHRN